MKKIFAILISMLVVLSACEPVETDHGEGENTELTPGEGTGNNGEGTGNEGGDGEGNEEQKEVYYVAVTGNLSDWSGDYLITYTSGGSIKVFDSFSANDKGSSTKDLGSKLTADGIHSDDGDPYKAVVSKTGDGYSVFLTGQGYLGLEASKNSISKSSNSPTASDKKYLWKFSYASGCVWMTNVNNSGYRLQWNSSANCFRCYNGSQAEITLYRRSTSTGGTQNPPSGGDDGQGGGDNTGGDTGGDNTGGNTGGDGGDDNTGGDNTGSGGNTGGGDDDEEIPTPVPGQSGKYGWYELPVMNLKESGGYLTDANDSDLYYAYHHCAGPEKSGGKKARNYTVCYSAEHHCPVWVAAPRHAMYQTKATDRTDAYGKDPSIPSGIQYNSKSTGGGCNKGHMLGSAERTSSAATNRQVFYYTNIAPQYSSSFNTGGGGWNTLEDWVDGKVCSDTLYVVIGTHFKTFTDGYGYTGKPATISFGGRSDVTRPSMFYYILLRTKKGNTGKPLSECKRDEIMCAAFVRSHEIAKGTKVSAKDLMSVSDLEKITGFSYFPNVPQAPKDSYNASDWGL